MRLTTAVMLTAVTLTEELTMAIKNEREYRKFPGAIETRAGEGEECRVAGYASTFEKYSLGMDWDDNEYFEQVDPHAFDEADLSDVIFLYNHEGMVYARKKNGTLDVSVDEHGLKVDADLSKTEESRRMFENIRSGMIDQMSFAFTVREDSYDRETRTRTILKIDKVYDVSAVSLPANPDTDISAVSARNYLHGVMEMEKAERLEREKREAARQHEEKAQHSKGGYKAMTYKDIDGYNIVGINNKLAELAEQRTALMAGEVKEETNEQLKSIDASIKALNERKAELEAIEKRMKDAQAVAEGAPAKVAEARELSTKPETEPEKRARQLIDTGKMEVRQLLSTGTLIPSAVKQDIGELPEVMSTIVDDVHSFTLDGNAGSWQFAYRKTDSSAATVTEGEEIGGESGTFDKGEIKPETWGILDEISNQVKHFTPLAYEASIRNNAYLALRRYAKRKITKEICTSTLVDKVENLKIDENFLRNLVLGFNADESVAGGAKLYLTKKTLAKLGAIRGTENKRALYEITFSNENNGTIQEGGLSVNFSILSDLGVADVMEGADTKDVLIYGQMQSVDVPLWGNYTIETDEGGDYFKRNMMGIRGLQSAAVGVTKMHTVQVVVVSGE